MRWFHGLEAHRRSFSKAVSWRSMASLDTFVVSFVVTGRVGLAGSIAGTEMVTKIALLLSARTHMGGDPVGPELAALIEITHFAFVP